MSMRYLIPCGRDNGNQVPSLLRDDERDPFLSLHREVNRLFDDVFRGFGSGLPSVARTSAFSTGWPSVEISDTDKEIKVTAEVPVLEEKDSDVLLNDGVLTLKGEKRSESDDKDRHFYERYYERRLPLGFEVKEDEVNARFKKSDNAQFASVSPSDIDDMGAGGKCLRLIRVYHLKQDREAEG